MVRVFIKAAVEPDESSGYRTLSRLKAAIAMNASRTPASGKGRSLRYAIKRSRWTFPERLLVFD
jgi:hypothetical protein